MNVVRGKEAAMSMQRQTSKTVQTAAPAQSRLLQRACGGNPGLTGECAECKKKREGTLQRKVANLTVGPPNDHFEQEADRVAAAVVGGSGASSASGVLAQLQRRATTDDSLGVAPPIVHDVLQSSGQSLDTTTRSFMEPRFGHDFSSVRIHTDARAAESARAVNALAYTVGRDVVFGAGQHQPQSSTGQRLMAHELAHVVQQSGSEGMRVGQNNGNGKGGLSPISDQGITNNALLIPSPNHALSATQFSILQRTTEQPELQAGIDIGSSFGGATTGFITTCLMRIVGPVLAGMMVYRIVKILSASGAKKTQLMNEFITSMFPILGHATTFCNCMPPHVLAALAEWSLQDYPDALAHFHHYLIRGGQPFVEDIPRMLREDSGARKEIEEGIAHKKVSAGDLPNTVMQDTWSTQNWKRALGSVDLFSYEILQDKASRAANALANDGTGAVRVSISDPYEWHPDEGKRKVPCLHTVMEAMKASGAKDFLAIGEGVVRLSVPKNLLPLP